MSISYEYSIWGVSYIHIERRFWSCRFTRCVSFNVPDPGTIWDDTVHALRLHCVPPCLLFILDHQCKGYHRYLWDFLHHIYSGDNWCGGWQLMWPFWFVAVPVCGRFGLWPFRFVAVPVCGRFCLWPFSVCGRFGFVAVPVCGRFGCGRFGLWPLWPVTAGDTQWLDHCLHFRRSCIYWGNIRFGIRSSLLYGSQRSWGATDWK